MQATNYAIIVAGGSGTRMQSALPKQFLLLNGRPLMFYTLEAFSNSAAKPRLIVVMHPDFHAYWAGLCERHKFNVPHSVVAGGSTRFHSVKNGFDTVDDVDALIAVHDAVRPLTSPDVIDHAYQHTQKHGNAVVAVKSRDSVRRVKNGLSTALVRDEIYLVQTPQTFTYRQLQEAYQQPYNDSFTDDASVVEAAGYTINLVEGNDTNIKITYPADIAIAEILLSKKPSP
ncbi:2-C-methyl-D-erythritol 4-phosphate cytidylyltransferase [Mucilaginibacter sp. UR6-1]|uniref:2-C-methyl-D-erythritol 4-phosphate cytidylyltransferase n=1 Tax=Mucilaginibacter sp. UR6-1 TaxID=1435643 RepID=UPI001E565DF6|nr:2-C-methyl-D-erythritol 4-phosphate cytidylyltransferase [Mucilaginibacter sp. UR6-1]MCC8407306.1 2-C-methyl-D-erythritol 4-phosphate cytidylyltransferase [Mucilaginibacter sp. UR6-1]